MHSTNFLLTYLLVDEGPARRHITPVARSIQGWMPSAINQSWSSCCCRQYLRQDVANFFKSKVRDEVPEGNSRIFGDIRISLKQNVGLAETRKPVCQESS